MNVNMLNLNKIINCIDSVIKKQSVYRIFAVKVSKLQATSKNYQFLRKIQKPIFTN